MGQGEKKQPKEGLVPENDVPWGSSNGTDKKKKESAEEEKTFEPASKKGSGVNGEKVPKKEKDGKRSIGVVKRCAGGPGVRAEKEKKMNRCKRERRTFPSKVKKTNRDLENRW